MEEEEIYTIEEVANKLRMSTRTIYSRIYTGQTEEGRHSGDPWIEAYKDGLKWRITAQALKEYHERLRSATTVGKPKEAPPPEEVAVSTANE